MVHLPNEIWLQIATYCDAKDLWLSLRPVNRQLSACAEQHFNEFYLPQAVLDLKIRIPTYDMRNPRQSSVTFRPLAIEAKAAIVDDGSSRATFCMFSSDPEYYASHFLSRWKGMVESQGGRLRDQMQWGLSLCGRHGPVRLSDPNAVFVDEGGNGEGQARLVFEWRETMTGFLESSRTVMIDDNPSTL